MNKFQQQLCEELPKFIGKDGKPYLRPLTNMTEEEHSNLFNAYHYLELKVAKSTGDYLKAAYIGDDAKYKWLLENKFDFLDLISDGLAIEITEENNPYKL